MKLQAILTGLAHVLLALAIFGLAFWIEWVDKGW